MQGLFEVYRRIGMHCGISQGLLGKLRVPQAGFECRGILDQGIGSVDFVRGAEFRKSNHQALCNGLQAVPIVDHQVGRAVPLAAVPHAWQVYGNEPADWQLPAQLAQDLGRRSVRN